MDNMMELALDKLNDMSLDAVRSKSLAGRSQGATALLDLRLRVISSLSSYLEEREGDLSSLLMSAWLDVVRGSSSGDPMLDDPHVEVTEEMVMWGVVLSELEEEMELPATDYLRMLRGMGRRR